MASHAAMLLDPRAYRKRIQTNGNNSPGYTPYGPSNLHSDATSTKGPDIDGTLFFPSRIRCPSPPEDPVYGYSSSNATGSQSVGLLGEGTTGQSDPGRQSSRSHATTPSLAPAGTVTATHQFLSPQRLPLSRRTAKSRSPRRDASRSSSAGNRTAKSPQHAVRLEPTIDVQYAAPTDFENGNNENGATDTRHGSLLEDMYGVERRENQPRKRIKTVDPLDEQQQQAKRRNFAMVGNSGLGEWMKEDQGESKQSFSATNIVDLTLGKTNESTIGGILLSLEIPDAPSHGDDDDLQVTGSNNLSIQRVCYGKLENAMVQAIMVPRPAAQNIFGDSAHDWPSLKLGVHREANQGNNRIDVSDPHGKIFGAIDAKTAAVIVSLLDSPALRVDITARLDVRRRSPDEYPWGPCSAFYRASINLYGLRKDADIVGRHLGQNNVWLGTPNSVEQGVPVFNPHAERRRAQASFLPAVAARGRSGVNYEVRTAEEVNDAVMKMFDQLQSAENLPEMQPPSIISTRLLRHQRQGLWYMTEKEKPRKFGPKEEDNNSLWRVDYRPNGSKKYREIISGLVLDEEPPQSLGGLLADMMGLGKTLSILSLVASSLEQASEWEKMTPHPELVKTLPNIRNTRTTLLVAPLSAVNNWVSQIKEHVIEGGLSYYVFHGSNRTSDVDKLSQYDLVITTYSIVLSEISGRGSKRCGVSPLTKMNMFRIVLDEAHTIREQSAAQTQAIFKLNSERRWSVTGTPIQNRLDDLLSVTKFLGLVPYEDRSRFAMHILSRFKTGDATVLASLRVLVDSFTLRRVKDKVDIPTRHDKIITLDFSEKERQLHEFFRKESNVLMSVIAGQDQTKMKGRMYHHVLKAMMILRQISAHGKELLEPEDRERIKGVSAHDAIDLEEGGEITTGLSDKKAYEMFTLMQQSSADACAVCAKRLEEPSTETGASDKKTAMAIVLPCFDVLCPDCFSGWKKAFKPQMDGSLNDTKCQICEGWIPATYSTITPAGLQEYEVNQAQAKQSRKQAKAIGEYEGPHTKTKALLASILDSAEATKTLPEGEKPMKSVVFSAWTSHLDLIEIALKDNNITGYTRLDGTMSLSARHHALEAFHNDNSITILLATIGAGGVGLNLTAASNVYIMEPQYNPAAVAQAVDRVHRLGQTREVNTVQFVMKGSIEEKIFDLAKKKQQLADLSMNRGKLDKKEVQEARMQEYRSLFR